MFTSLVKRLATPVNRRLFSDFPKGCGWEYIVQRATCKREADKLEYTEECGICPPLTEKSIEPSKDIVDLTPINGTPCEAYNRNTAIIQKRTKSSMQSGTANTHAYILSFIKDVTWENPLMGWTAGSNSLTDVEIPFPSKESAVNYAMRNGWDFYIRQEPKMKKMRPKNYGANFVWNKRTRVSTK